MGARAFRKLIVDKQDSMQERYVLKYHIITGPSKYCNRIFVNYDTTYKSIIDKLY